MILLLVVLPLVGAGIAFAIPSNRQRPWVLPLTASLHLALVAYLLPQGDQWMFDRWLAIDPMGVWGDPAYEPANAFRNPDGAADLVFRPDRITHLANRFAHHLGHPRRRLLGWAAAHCALSTRWSLQDGRDITEDLRLLPLLLAAARR